MKKAKLLGVLVVVLAIIVSSFTKMTPHPCGTGFTFVLFIGTHGNGNENSPAFYDASTDDNASCNTNGNKLCGFCVPDSYIFEDPDRGPYLSEIPIDYPSTTNSIDSQVSDFLSIGKSSINQPNLDWKQ